MKIDPEWMGRAELWMVGGIAILVFVGWVIARSVG
jgi:hypothetical protein